MQNILDFLACKTPTLWLQAAVNQQEILLIDHAHCEKKAASTALSLMYRYPERTELLQKMSRLAREELRHFEKVLAFIEARGMQYSHLSSSRYASELRQHVRAEEPYRLIDVLIIGAFIEARSCERFNALAPLLDPELGKFYQSLLRSESRHYQDYLKLAKNYSDEPIDERIEFFRNTEAELINSPDEQFRFHSGVPK